MLEINVSGLWKFYGVKRFSEIYGDTCTCNVSLVYENFTKSEISS